MLSRHFYLLMIASLLCSLWLCLHLVGGRAEKAIFSLVEEATDSKVELNSYYLQQYLETRVQILRDLSSTPLLANAVMGSDTSRANLVDFLDNHKILGIKESIVVLDIAGDAVYTNRATGSSAELVEASWFQGILEGNSQKAILLKRVGVEEHFVIAVPISYGSSVEGVLLVEFSDNLDYVFSTLNADRAYAVSLKGPQLSYSTKTKEKEYKVIKSTEIGTSGLTLEHFVETDLIEQKKDGFMRDIGLAIISSLILMFGGLALLGRQFILNPYKRLEASRKEIELAKEQNDLLVQAIEASPLGVSVADATKPDQPLTYVNSAFCRITGYEIDETIGKNCRFLQGKDTEKAPIKDLRESIGRAEERQVEFINYTKSGEAFWNSLYISPVFNDKRELVAYVGIMEDVTARKNNEKALELSHQLTSKALADLREQKFALDQHSIVAITNTRGDITFANQKFSDISGYEIDELIGRNHRMLNSGTHDIGFFMDMYAAISHGEVWHGEICNRKKNGDLYWVDTTIVPFKDEKGKPVSYVAIRTDITERKRFEAQLTEARDEALVAAKTKSEFLANMSHEIRTPMNGVLGMLRLALKDEMSEEHRHKIEVAQNSANSLLVLINDILDLSKIEAGKLIIENIPFDIHEMLEQFMASMKSLLEGKQLDLSLDKAGLEETQVSGDPGRIRQILTNLVGNAIKFTEQGRVSIRVYSVTSNGGETTLHFLVEDTGIGISESALPHLFAEFSQVDASTTRKYGGTGLGLSIVKRLCLQMGGNISVKSELGVGSVFEFHINVEKVNADNSSVSLPQQMALESDAAPQVLDGIDKSGKVLLVEDNDINQFVALGMLEDLGLEAVCADNGKEALARLRENEGEPYALILMDCQMPEMDGYQATMAIRNGDAGEASSNIPVIAMTAHAMEGDEAKCRDAGMDDYITKPLEPDVAEEKIAHWLSRKRSDFSVQEIKQSNHG